MTGTSLLSAERSPQSDGTPRLVLLGASNLTRALRHVIRMAWRVHGHPLEILVAAGRGRSYGTASSLLGRRLPGIRECGLWKSLSRGERRPTTAIVTDIGNDLIYGSAPEEVVGWVAACLERLEAADSRITMTLPPMERLLDAPRWQLTVLAKIIFPTRRAPLTALLDGAHRLDELLRELVNQRGVRLVKPDRAWYGLDPIHLRRRSWPAAWGTIVGAAAGTGLAPAADTQSPMPGLPWLMQPELQHVLGCPLRRPQPAYRLPDGGTISLF